MRPLRKPSIFGLLVKVGIPFTVVATGLWAVNRYLGTTWFWRVLSIVLLLLLILAILWFLIWLIRKLISAISGARYRRQMARAAAPAIGATAQEQSELDALQERLNTALRVIRESKLARGRKQDEALYALPWIILLGPPGSGKTTVLRECGVDFPHTTGEGRQRRGMQSGCEYWFSREAVVLDLAGRFGAEEEGFEVFKGFLDQLKRGRRARPLDAVVVAVSLKDILEQSTDQAEFLANSLRQRFSEMIRRLGVRFPIYILFTKCDESEGFQAFFGNLRSRDRAQVWGATISRAQRKGSPADQIFREEFDQLAEALSTYRLQLMASEKDHSKLSRIYTFPSRFTRVRDKLANFVGALLQPTPYSERPVFRGFYFASAAETRPQEAHSEEIVEKWDPQRRLGGPERPVTQAKNYFLQNLFSKVIFADRPLATASVDARLRRRLWLDVALVATIVVCAILLVGMTYSFTQNRKLIDSTSLAARHLTDPSWNPKRTADLSAMQDLRATVVRLEQSPEWSLRWGLYTGADISQASRNVYRHRLRESFVTPTGNALRQKLSTMSVAVGCAHCYEDLHTYLKAYLMMTEPDRAESTVLKNTLSPFWKQLVPKEGEGIALDQLDYYVERLRPNGADLQLTRDAQVVERARLVLRQAPTLERIYNSLKTQGNSKIQPYTLAQATGGKSLDYLNSNYSVPGVFTVAGWSTYFFEALKTAGKRVVEDDWVLGNVNPSLPSDQATVDYSHEIKARYLAEYSDHWQRFLESISVRPLIDLSEARKALESLSQQDSALSRLLLNVAKNTMLPKEPAPSGDLAKLYVDTMATLGLGAKVDRTALVELVADEFQPLHELVNSSDAKTPSRSAEYVILLGNVYTKLEMLFGAGTQWDQVKTYVDSITSNVGSNEFRDGYGLIASVRKQCKTKSTRPIGDLLDQPLRQTWAAILREAGNQLDSLWKAQVAEAFRRDVESFFPFNTNSAQDLPLSMLSQYLKPREGLIDVFYDNQLKMFLKTEGNRYVPKDLMREQVNFSRPFLDFMANTTSIRQAIFGLAAEPSVPFDLTPQGTPGVNGSILEIDGQKLPYRNEPEIASAFAWPGKSGTPKAKISITITGSSESPNISPADGQWAFFRLLRRATVVPINPTTYTVTWSLSSSDGRRFDVKYKLQARNAQNPFATDFFADVHCPDRVTLLPATASVAGYAPLR